MNRLTELYKSIFLSEPEVCQQLTGSASNRRYYRLSGSAGTCIGVIGTDVKENEAFAAISRHFHSMGINVPEVLAVSAAQIRERISQLENLKTVRRKDVAEKIKEARGQGDLSENAEYDAAKEEQAEIEAMEEEERERDWINEDIDFDEYDEFYDDNY